MKKNIGILFLSALALGACVRNPLRVYTSKTTLTATSTATQTVSQSSVDTKTDTSSATATQTKSATDTGTGSGTATVSDTSTATNTGTQASCTPKVVVKVMPSGSITVSAPTIGTDMIRYSLTATCKDQTISYLAFGIVALGYADGNTRPFLVGSASDPNGWNFRNLRVKDVVTGNVIAGPLDHPAQNTSTQPAYLPFKDQISLSVGTDKLISVVTDIPASFSSDATATKYQVLFMGLNNVGGDVVFETESLPTAQYPTVTVTQDCVAASTRHCYSGPAGTENVGRCHGATQECVMTDKGPKWDASCVGEVTPYPWGDIMDNGIDDDCNGIVDDGAYFCPVNNSTISQGCCMPEVSSFPRPLLSDLKHQPGAYTLVKGSNPFVYLYASDGKRYVFTSKDVIKSWFTGFDGGPLGDLVNVCNTVNELSDVELASITIGGNVTIRPGSYIVKIASDPKLYVVSKGKVLSWLSTPDLAEKLYPGTSAQRIHVVPEAFFVNYYIGLQVSSVSDYDPAAEWAAANLETEAATK
jgi:hypothetical protein